MTDFKKKYGLWAVVAGASEGIGQAYAKGLAKRGLNLVLIARRPEPLKETEQIVSDLGVEVKALQLDLSSPDMLEKVDAATKGLDIGIMVYNAAYGPVRPFLSNTVEQLRQHTGVNCDGPMLLSHYFGKRFAEQGRGGIILMSSMAGFQGTAMVAPYAATKGFDTVLGEALHYELKSKGVDVMVCAAGATKTPNYLSTEPQYGAMKPSELEPATVAEGALNALGSRSLFIPGTSNRFAHAMFRVFSRSFASKFFSNTMFEAYAHFKEE
jgi:short-subunit dehydrogenase